ncbi:MAG: EAL domain-containing protein, partial [Pontibacterium sp.]
AVISLALEHIDKTPHDTPVAVNISTDSLCSAEFLIWFKGIVAKSGQQTRLHIEVNESSILNNLDRACEFRSQLKDSEVSFGVDNFGIHPAGFSYLYSLQPDYIKIDGSLIREIDTQAEDRFYISSLIAIAHSLSVKAYAEHVERETQLMELSKLQIDGTQGWLHGQPERLTAD